MFRSCLSGTVLGPTLGPLSPQWSRSGGPLGPLKASLGALWRPLGSISGPWAPFAVSFLHQTFTPQASICIGGGKPATYYLLLLYPGQAGCAKRLSNIIVGRRCSGISLSPQYFDHVGTFFCYRLGEVNRHQNAPLPTTSPPTNALV